MWFIVVAGDSSGRQVEIGTSWVRTLMVSVDTPVLDRAISLTRKYRLRGYDAVQLATALLVNDHYIIAGLPTLTFIVADDDLVHAARTEGLVTDNPNWHP